MKLSKVVLATVAVIAMVCSCATAKGKVKPKSVANKAELVDWQGATLGREVPEWVNTVIDGNNLDVPKALKIDDSKVQTFVVSVRDPDLDFAKAWADGPEARRQISTSISQIVATTTEAAVSGMSGVDEQTKTKLYNDSTSMASAIELNGLMKTASYWIKTRTLHVGVKAKKATDDDYTIEYTYFVVFQIDREIYQKQVDAAMAKVEDNTSEESYLKRVIAEKISQTILPGNTLGESYHGEKAAETTTE